MKPEDRQLICWILRDSAEKADDRFSSLCRALEGHGYAITRLYIPNSGPETTTAMSGAWLGERLPAGTHVIFCSDHDPVWVAELVNAARMLGSSAPVIWLNDQKVPMAEIFADMGIDDIFPADIPIAELLLRLRLRWVQADQLVRLEAQLKEQQLKIAKSETTLKQREEFLGVCAHDLRSPLGLIQSSLAMILNGEKVKKTLSELHTELLTRARRQAGQAITLVNDLLDVMSFEQGFKPRYHLVTIHDLLQEFYKDYSFQAEQKGVKFHYDNPVKDWRVLADSDRVRQLLQNLFTNALKFTDSGKNIHLKVASFIGRRKCDPPYPMMVISLKDEGVGIPKSEMQKIFDRFSQVKDYSRKEGRGLGLTVAKQISTLHDGNIWVESEEGKGSTFNVLFPHVVSRTTLDKSPSGGVKKILIAEPSYSKRAEYNEKLRAWGYEPLFARDGIEVITLLFHTMPDAIILTPGLTKMEEAEVADLIKTDRATSALPILMALDPGHANRKLEDVLYDEPLELPYTKESLEKALSAARKKQSLPNRRLGDRKKAA